jgi:acyl-CoA reductase-like NAD-dependent aldehyde dehydrogenase
VRRVTAERSELPALYQCGGKGVAIVLDDADVDRTAYEVLVGAFVSAGQRHNSTARVIVTDRVYDAFVAELVRRTQRINIGYGFDSDTFMGPVISENFRVRFRKYCRAVASKGHTAVLEGEAAEVEGLRGNYVRPGIYEMDWTNGHPFLNDEPPGPIVLVYRVKTWEDAASLHNQMVYRVATSVFARPDNPALGELRDRLSTGALNLNRSTIASSPRLPSIGLGRSGNGIASGAELLRFLTYPRAMLAGNEPFQTGAMPPGVNWLDGDGEEEADLGGALELAVE